MIPNPSMPWLDMPTGSSTPMLAVVAIASGLFAVPCAVAGTDATLQTNSEPIRTKFVLSSQEPILSPYPRADNLPATLSIDAFTPQEIRQIQQDVYDSIKSLDQRPHEGVAGCMKWLFFRTEPKAPWRAFGVVGAGQIARGMAKINGRFYPAGFHYSIDPKHRSGLVGALFGATAGKGPGRGRSSVNTFVPKQSFAQFLADKSNDDKLAYEINSGARRPSEFRLAFGDTRNLVVESADGQCSHLKARCRRYVFQSNLKPKWFGSRQPDEKSSVELPISVPANIKYEMAIEDMCPFGPGALVEPPINARSGGAEPGVRKFGLPDNASLKAALRPYVSE